MGHSLTAKKTRPYFPSRFWILLLILVPSCDLGPEKTVFPLPHKVTMEKTPATVPLPNILPMKKKLPLGEFTGKNNISFDRDAFLMAFKRQSYPSLYECLESWRQRPDSVLVKAQLQKNGKILRPESLEADKPLPLCAVKAIESMDFKEVLPQLKANMLAIQWQIAW